MLQIYSYILQIYSVEIYEHIEYPLNMIYNEKDTMKRFGENIKKYRNRLGLTQEKLAELCNCSSQTISGTETGYSFPSSKVLFKLAENLHVPLMYLFNFGEDPVISNKEENSTIINYLSEMDLEQKKIALKIIKALIDL